MSGCSRCGDAFLKINHLFDAHGDPLCHRCFNSLAKPKEKKVTKKYIVVSPMNTSEYNSLEDAITDAKKYNEMYGYERYVAEVVGTVTSSPVYRNIEVQKE